MLTRSFLEDGGLVARGTNYVIRELELSALPALRPPSREGRGAKDGVNHQWPMS